ncbi:MAG: hypothetical protein DRP97_02450 [Candidatus Latescibacterota bacterium]|nr:MAG: hypothetical protein DRP97_02450 [Candidatus Latescibacterota bacterium]
MRKTMLLLLLLTLLTSSSLLSAQELDTREPRTLIECPTAGLLPRGSFDFDLRIFPNGGMLSGVNIGLMNRLLIGFSFGGEGIIGNGSVDWYPGIEFGAKYRLFEEGQRWPAIAIGFDSQGFGHYDEDLERYARKSKGFYAAMSKNYNMLGTFALHAGVNYSLEREDGDDDVSGFIGLNKALNDELSIMAEYDLALNDNDDKSLVSGEGYLNTGVRWTFADRLNLEFDLKDLTEKRRGNEGPVRELRITYVEYF